MGSPAAEPQANSTAGEIEAAALQIAEALQSVLLVADDGSFGGLGICRQPGGERYQFMALSRGLFRGTMGIDRSVPPVNRMVGL